MLSWANHPRALPLAVPAAVIHMAAARAMEVVVLRPQAYALPQPVLDRARAGGGSVVETDDREAALQGAHVLYAKSWASPAHYGDGAAESSLRASLGDWCVDLPWFTHAHPACRFLHCLPVRRNVVVTDTVLDSPRSAVVAQAGNRLWAQMAVLHRLLGGPR